MLVATAPPLIIPGLQPNGQPITLIDAPGFDRHARFDQRRGAGMDVGLDEIARCVRDTLNTGIVGMLTIDTIDRRTGRIKQRIISHNVETDTWANNALKLFGSGGASASIGQFIGIDTATLTAVQSGATINTASGAQTSITVVANPKTTAALVSGNASASWGTQAASGHGNGTGQDITPLAGAVPDAVYGTGIAWSYGVTANIEYWAGTTGNGTATTIPLQSATVTGGKSHVAGDFVVAGPGTPDGSSATPPTGITYSPAQAASYTTTAGIGNRKAQLSYIFPTSTPAASYTGIWIVTTVTWAANVAYAHVCIAPLVINASTTGTVTYTALM